MDFTNCSLCIIAYHGTFDAAADNIIETKTFQSNFRDDHWLGQGIYFFREDFEQAKQWGKSAVEKQLRKGHIKKGKIAVIRAILNVERKNFWNLDTREDLIRFNKHVLKELAELEKQKIELEISLGESEKLRCYFCDLIDDDIYLIQRTFSGNSYLDQYKMLMDMGLRQHGTQLCVRNQHIIDFESIECIKLEEISIFNLRQGKRYNRSIVFE